MGHTEKLFKKHLLNKDCFHLLAGPDQVPSRVGLRADKMKYEVSISPTFYLQLLRS